MTSSLIISEEFVSIQGEGALVGTPSYFVRVTGCPLRCSWCDEPSTSWTPKGERRTVNSILGRIGASGLRHVVITGGEPFSQAATVELAIALRVFGLHVTIETSGAVARPELVCDLMSISPKLSHSTPKRRGEFAAGASTEREPPTVGSSMSDRLLAQRDAARAAGDALARVVLDHLAGKPADLEAALCAYRNVDGPAWALPPSGGWVVTRGPEGDLVSPQPSGLRLPWYLRDRERAACLLPADGLWNAPTPCGATICGVAKDTREMHERLHFENCLHGCKAAP